MEKLVVDLGNYETLKKLARAITKKVPEMSIVTENELIDFIKIRYGQLMEGRK